MTIESARSLTLNLGVRYERLGQFGDKLGRNSSFDVSKANANPPPSGSLDGYIVASNFPGVLPSGVIRANNSFGNYGEGQNTIAPRIGFAWQVLPKTSRLALRGGYGIYYSRPTGQAASQSVLAAPFSLTRINTGANECGRDISSTLCTAFSHADFFPIVCTLFSDHAVFGQRSSPQFSAGNGSTVLPEHPGRISIKVGCWRLDTWVPGEHTCNASVR